MGRGEGFARILQVFSGIWREYVTTLDASRLLSSLETTFPRKDEGDLLYMGTTQVWRGSDNEKKKLIEALKSLVNDNSILKALHGLESSKEHLEV